MSFAVDVDGQAGVPSTVLLFFTRRSSGPARRMDSLIAHYARVERGRLRVVRVDVEKHRRLAGSLSVREIPTIVLLRNRKQIARIEGRASGAQMRELIETHLPAS